MVSISNSLATSQQIAGSNEFSQKVKVSIYTLQLETVSFLLILFWMTIAKLQGQATKEAWKLPLDYLVLFTNFYGDDFDRSVDKIN